MKAREVFLWMGALEIALAYMQTNPGHILVPIFIAAGIIALGKYISEILEQKP